MARGQLSISPDDLAALVYTSGTTGPPKGVMYTHRNVVWALEAFRRSGAGPMDHGRIVSYLPRPPLFEVWGMSELTGPATAVPLDSFRIGSVGAALPGIDVRLADDGELLVRGGNVTSGYYRDPERTAEAIDRDGWMRTGDIGPSTRTATSRSSTGRRS